MAHYQPLHYYHARRGCRAPVATAVASQIRIEPLTKPVQTIAGCDISFNKFEETVYAGICLTLRYDEKYCIPEPTRCHDRVKLQRGEPVSGPKPAI